jgi:hypothetical protein
LASAALERVGVTPAGTVRFWLQRGEAACDLPGTPDLALISSCFVYARMLLDESEVGHVGFRYRMVRDSDPVLTYESDRELELIEDVLRRHFNVQTDTEEASIETVARDLQGALREAKP